MFRFQLNRIMLRNQILCCSNIVRILLGKKMAIECLLFKQIILYFVGKSTKVRLTGVAASNALGEKLPIYVIGKSANPGCFKHIKSLPCKYTNQAKSWMDSDIFTRWL